MSERAIRTILAVFCLVTAAAIPVPGAAESLIPLPGDVDGNGVINEADRVLMAQLLAGNRVTGQVNAANADVNEDGRLGALDGAWLGTMSPPFRGAVVSRTATGSVGKTEAALLLQYAGFSDLLPARYDVNLYKLVYRTLDPWGGMVHASGLMGLPAGLPGSLPLVALAHGTETRKEDVPSNPDYSLTPSAAAIFASSGGYGVVAPDFLGLGDSPGLHPYLHAASEATCALDAMRAARAAVGFYGAAFDQDLFLAGYSQGGHVTMALHRLIEARHAAEFPVTACAPMAGPYDLSGTTVPFVLNISTPGSAHVAYLPYTLLSMDLVYDVWSDPAGVFVSPYDVTVFELFDGAHDAVQIGMSLPPIPRNVLVPAYLSAVLSDENHPLNRAIRDNDLCDWAPIAPLRMYHGSNDSVVPFANAEVAYDRMYALGGNVNYVNVGPYDHGSALAPCIHGARLWFDSLRRRAEPPGE